MPHTSFSIVQAHLFNFKTLLACSAVGATRRIYIHRGCHLGSSDVVSAIAPLLWNESLVRNHGNGNINRLLFWQTSLLIRLYTNGHQLSVAEINTVYTFIDLPKSHCVAPILDSRITLKSRSACSVRLGHKCDRKLQHICISPFVLQIIQNDIE